MPVFRQSIVRLALLLVAIAALAACGAASDVTTGPGAAGETIDELRIALRKNKHDTGLRVRLARLYIEKGDGAAAEAYLRRALADGSVDPDVPTDLVRSLLLQGEHFEALEAVDALERARGGATARLWLLRAEAQLGIENFDRVTVRRSFVQAFRALRGQDDRATALRLEELARSVPVVSDARAHATCQDIEMARYEPPPAPAGARVLRVGPSRDLKIPSAAARVARDGDRIEIDAGTYRGDVAVWEQNDLVLVGTGGMARLEADGRAAKDMAIWVFEGDRITAQNIAFSGAKVRYRNGAGIRIHGADATIRNCHFHDNENGILAGNKPHNNVLVEYSIFERNGYGDGQSHNIYVGRGDRFVMRYSLSRASNVGHLVKSRARESVIAFNRLIDDGGNGSYLIDLPDGGRGIIVGNEMQKGSENSNPHFISFGEEVADRPNQALLIVNNTFYNNGFNATIVHNATEYDTIIANNLFAGAPALLNRGPAVETHNLRRPGAWLADTAGYDYRLTPEAPAIDAGLDPATIPGLTQLPDAEYRHPARGQSRRNVGPVDIGAREFCGP